MAAQFDRSQKHSFYYGNADKDLAHLFPQAPEDQKSAANEILAILERADKQIEELNKRRRLLSFVIADLKRMIA